MPTNADMHCMASEPGAGGSERGRIVVKVGSAVVAPGGVVDEVALDRLCDDVARAWSRTGSMLLVSSGAVAAGFAGIGLSAMPKRIRDKQAAAAIGQPRLLRSYAERLARHGITAAQVLLTADDFDHRTRFINVRHTLETLMKHRVLPIINENDSITYEEIRLGDNDRLSALVASAVDADLLLLLSSAPGLIHRETGEVIPTVARINHARTHVTNDRSTTGTGGMKTKLDAAEIAVTHGVPVVITRGPTPESPSPINDVLGGRPIGTRFELPPGMRGPALRKSWIAFGTQVRGAIIVDEGAAVAIIRRGASLLPSGVLRVEGDFREGATVEIRDPAGAVIARGLSSYDALVIERIKGMRTADLASVLGQAYSDEIVHRDDLLVLGKENA